MTPTELAQLSMQVAEALGMRGYVDGDICQTKTGPINAKWQRFMPSTDTDCAMRLAAEHLIAIAFDDERQRICIIDKNSAELFVRYKDHNGDRLAAMRIAICKAIIEGARK